jgi:hypothetical protein
MIHNSKYDIKDCIELATLKGGKCLSLKYSGSNKLEWECSLSHKWSANFHHILHGSWCSVCHKNNLKMGINSKRLKKEDVLEKLNKLGFEFLSEEYVSLAKKYTLKCKNGHIFDDKPLRHIIAGTVGCGSCNNYFNSENKFRKKLEKIFNKKFPKSRPSWLLNPDTNRKLELDCYSEELNIAYEYDGHFHFEVRNGINNNLEKTKHLDSLKNKICLNNGVKLIRVPYFLKNKEFYEKIEKHFAEKE